MTDQHVSNVPAGLCEPDNPAAAALAQHIADHPMSTIQAAFRILGMALAIEIYEADADATDERVEQLARGLAGAAHINPQRTVPACDEDDSDDAWHNYEPANEEQQ